jgi:hypothetical protein
VKQEICCSAVQMEVLSYSKASVLTYQSRRLRIPDDTITSFSVKTSNFWELKVLKYLVVYHAVQNKITDLIS